jgi:nucleoid-associated protein YgaU
LPSTTLYVKLRYVYIFGNGDERLYAKARSNPTMIVRNDIVAALADSRLSRRLRVKRTTLLLLLSMLILIGLSACERPAPGSRAPQTTATPAAPIFPTVLPPIGVSPTPEFAATLDPNAPVGATAVPGATVDPLAPPPATETPIPPAPEAQPAPTDAPPASTGEIIHIVQAGENLFRIGLRYGVDFREIAAYNGITNPDVLSVGQQIRIPPRP